MSNGIYKGEDVIRRITYDKIPERPELPNCTFGYTGGQQCVTLPPGKYKLEVRGAQGGHQCGGCGGYSCGDLTLTQETDVYVYVGGRGCCNYSSNPAQQLGGWNGGGYGYYCSYQTGGGGGGTDIRIGGTTVNHRRIVAGGGGGGGSYSYACPGGYGGGTNGGTGVNNGSGRSCGTGGTQTSGGTNGNGNAYYVTNGSFGQGGCKYSYQCYGGSGGGGGWRGGGPGGGYGMPGGGGSGYVYTTATCGTAPAGYCHCAAYLLTNAETRHGGTTNPAPGGNTEVGHAGCGCARIRGYCPEDYTIDWVKEYGYTGAQQSINLKKGIYKFEVWGAQGGNSSYGGKGGYARGLIRIRNNTTVYIYVGGAGGWTTTSGTCINGGWNGGGGGYMYSYQTGSGGGGTDIRIGGNSLYHRRLVAGGGGSGGYYSCFAVGGFGGGPTGGIGCCNCSGWGCGTGGSQTGGGSPSGGSACCYCNGSFGQGGCKYNATCCGGGGGGGGWYGGGPGGGYGMAGGGGSGYVYNADNCVNAPASYCHCIAFFLCNGCCLSGNVSMPSPNGSTETGHAGNGCVKITRFLADGDPIEYDEGFLGDKEVFPANIITCDFEYTGTVKYVTLRPGTHTFEVWGACGYQWSTNAGRGGGYSCGKIKIKEPTVAAVYVGGHPSSRTGGRNGGGNAVCCYSYGGGGGGASDIRLGGTTLYHRVIVAGGSGGGNYGYGNCNWQGGAGGGPNGMAGYYNNPSQTTSWSKDGGGGTQTTGGCNTSSSCNGSFGQGGCGSGYYGGAGGGGGWYGGAGGYGSSSSYVCCGLGGGGGSGYTRTEATKAYHPAPQCLAEIPYLIDAICCPGCCCNPSVSGGKECGHCGHGHVRIHGPMTTYYPVFCYGYTGAEQTVQLPAGTYRLEVWGASGFCCDAYKANRGGGYSVGCITLTQNTTLYLYVGGHPTGQAGGWNGGGNGYNSYGMGGGGGTDIRIGGNTLYHRVIVAGGSGGNNCSSSCVAAQGGAGGGACGMEGMNNSYQAQGANRSGGGASQTSGGCAWCTNGSAGIFGQGGTSCSGYNAGGGGGGWYGGGGAYDNDNDNDGRGGGGGSGYTWTAATCSYHPNPACLSGVPYLTGAACCPGCVLFPAPTSGNETGHFGHGCIKIQQI